MPGVLVDSASSSPHHHRSFFPFEPGYLPSGNLINGGSFGPIPSGNLRNGGLENSDLPTSSHSPLPPSHFQPSSELICSSSPSPTDAARELSQHARPRSNLGLFLNSNDSEQSYGSSFDMLPELNSVPIPSPRKNFHSTRPDSIVGSPVLSDINAVGSPVLSDVFSAFHKFLPSNNDEELWPADAFTTTDVYSCDDFRMYEFKVRRCMKGRSHDWTECPFAHPGEKARRRDPRRFHYSGTSCPDFRKGSCKRGDACEFAHGVFECWLHPARYRTQPCKDGRACRRRVCFFAHTVEQLRVLPSAMVSASPASPSSSGTSGGSSKMSMTLYDGSPLRQALGGSFVGEASDGDNLQKIVDNKHFGSTLVFGNVAASSPPYGRHTGSPPLLSPSLSPPSSPPTYTDSFSYLPRNVTAHMHPPSPLSNSPVPEHRRHLNRLQSVPTITIPPAASEALEAGMFDELFLRSPTSASSPRNEVSELRHALQALQLRSRVADLQRASSTPVSPLSHKWSSPAQVSPLRHCLYRSIHGTATTESLWDLTTEVNMECQSPERVESGRSLRAEIYGKIGKDNGVDTNSSGEVPDLGWVNELVK